MAGIHNDESGSAANEHVTSQQPIFGLVKFRFSIAFLCLQFGQASNRPVLPAGLLIRFLAARSIAGASLIAVGG